MRLRGGLMVLGLVVGAGLGWAEERRTAFTGEWALDLSRSTFSPGPAPRSFSLKFGEDGVRSLDLVTGGGQRLRIELPWSDGRPVEARGMAGVRVVSKIRGRKVRDTWWQGGRVLEEVRGEVSKDGRWLTMEVEGPLEAGGRFKNRVVFGRR